MDSGYYTNYDIDDFGAISSAGDDSGIPHVTIDQPSNYRTYTGGSGGIITGYYSNGYYNDASSRSAGDTNVPHEAFDDKNYYNYNSNGGATIATVGYYSIGYLGANGAGKITRIAPPDYSTIFAAADNGKYYSYSSSGECSAIADGPYTVGYYSDGVLHSTYTSSLPQKTNDNDTVYCTYVNGTATPADGYYSNGGYDTGSLGGIWFSGTFYYGEALQAIDDSKYYTYTRSGTSNGLATGYYSNGHYASGVLTGNTQGIQAPAQDAYIAEWLPTYGNVYQYDSNGTSTGVFTGLAGLAGGANSVYYVNGLPAAGDADGYHYGDDGLLYTGCYGGYTYTNGVVDYDTSC
jgi:hypothetical protein